MKQSVLYGRASMLFLGMAIGVLIGGAIIKIEMVLLPLFIIWTILLCWLYFSQKEYDEEKKEDKQERQYYQQKAFK